MHNSADKVTLWLAGFAPDGLDLREALKKELMGSLRFCDSSKYK